MKMRDIIWFTFTLLKILIWSFKYCKKIKILIVFNFFYKKFGFDKIKNLIPLCFIICNFSTKSFRRWLSLFFWCLLFFSSISNNSKLWSSLLLSVSVFFLFKGFFWASPAIKLKTRWRFTSCSIFFHFLSNSRSFGLLIWLFLRKFFKVEFLVFSAFPKIGSKILFSNQLKKNFESGFIKDSLYKK